MNKNEVGIELEVSLFCEENAIANNIKCAYIMVLKFGADWNI